MMFASVDPSTFPEVTHFDCRYHGDECYGCASESEWTEPYEPHNPVNCLLVALRNRGGAKNASAMLFIIKAMLYGANPDAETEHAIRVLERLARLEGGAS